MATFGKQKLLLHDVKRRNDLFIILPIVLLVLLLITGIGVITAFQSLNKNIMKSHNKVEYMQRQLESYQESLYRTRNMLHVELDALNQQFKTMLGEFENIKGNPGQERILLSERRTDYEETVEKIKEGILAMSLAIRNQRDELRYEFLLHNEDVESMRKDFANDYEKLMYFQNETRNELSKLMYSLNNQTYEAIENLTHYYTEKQQYNNYLAMTMKNFLSLNDSLQHYNNTSNFSENYYPNIPTERVYEINNTNQRQNTTYNGSNVIYPITLPIFREIQVVDSFDCLSDGEDLVDLINHTESQENRRNFSGLVLKKAGEIREFVSEAYNAYNKAFEKFRNSLNSEQKFTEEERREEQIENEEVEENNETTQLMIEGVTAVRQYVGDSLSFVESKLNSISLEENSTNESNFAEIFRNISSNIELLTQSNTIKSLGIALKYGEEMDSMLRKINVMLVEIKKKRGDFEKEKQMFLSLEHMFNYLEFLVERYLDNAQGGGNANLVRKWTGDFRDARNIYEGIRNVLLEEENFSMHKMSQKQFMKKIKPFMVNYHKAHSFPGI